MSKYDEQNWYDGGLEDNDYIYADIILAELNEEGIKKIYNEFEENKYFLIASILKQWKEGKQLSEKQIKCIAYFLADNGLGNWVEEF